MRWLKEHISIILPIFALLCSIEVVLLSSRALRKYEGVIGAHYSIVVVSKNALEVSTLEDKIGPIKSFEELSTKESLDKLKSSFLDNPIDVESIQIPYFYSLNFHFFPDQHKVKQMQQTLLTIKGIDKVEIFARSHTAIYRLLVLIKSIALTLFALIFIISFVLIIKQIEIWRFTHKERLEIMTYLGAPPKFKHRELYKLAFNGSIVSFILIIAIIIYLMQQPKLKDILQTIDINIFNLKEMLLDGIILIISAIICSFISVLTVVLFQKES